MNARLCASNMVRSLRSGRAPGGVLPHPPKFFDVRDNVVECAHPGRSYTLLIVAEKVAVSRRRDAGRYLVPSRPWSALYS